MIGLSAAASGTANAAGTSAVAEYTLVGLKNSLELREQVTVILPRSTPGLEEIARHDETSEARRIAVLQLLDGLAGEPLPDLGRERVTLRLVDSSAQIRWGSPQQIRSLDDYPEWDGRAHEDPPGFTRLMRRGDDLRLEVGRPAGTRITSEVHLMLETGHLLALAPLPERATDDVVVWRFDESDDSSGARATIDLDDEAHELLMRNDISRNAVSTGSILLGPIALFVLLFLASTAQASRLRQFAGAALAFSFVAVGVSLTVTLRDGVPFLRDSAETFVDERIITAVPLAAALAAAAVLGSVSAGSSRLRSGLLAVLAAGLGAAVGVLAATPTQRDVRPGLLRDAAEITWSGALVPLLLCAALAAGVVALLSRPPLSVGLRSWAARGLAMVVGLAGALQFVLEVHANDVPGDERRWWELLPFFSQFVPVSMTVTFLALLPSLAVVAALPWFKARLSGRPASALQHSDPAIRVVVVLFAGVVIGTGGRIDYVQAPLAFLLWLGIVTIAVGGFSIAEGSATGPLTKSQHKIILLRMLKGEAARRQAAKLRTELTAAGWKDTQSETEANAEQARADCLAVLGDEAPSTGEANVPTWKRALAIGPHDDAWANGRHAARLGMYAAIPPVMYAWVVIIDRDGNRFFSARSSDGLFAMLVQFAGEGSTWLVLAFTFGVLYAMLPGRHALPKVAAFALMLAIGLGLGELLSGNPDDTWAVRAFQMTLFLVAVGVLLDRATLTQHGLAPSDMFTLYRLRDLRFAAGYFPPLALLVLTVVQQLLSGQAEDAVTKTLEGVTAFLPDIPGR